MTPATSHANTPPWECNPHRLVSLWDMHKFYLLNFGTMIQSLGRQISIAEDMEQHLGCAVNIDAKEKKFLSSDVLELVEQECANLHLAHIVSYISRLHGLLLSNERYTPEIMLKDLRYIESEIIKAAIDIKFAYIPQGNDEYFEQKQLFGERFNDKFPEASKEIKDAGNCLAADLDTAAVFHLMRAAEFGMRAIARERKVHIKRTALEYADWERVLSELDKKADEVANWRGRGPAKAKALEFYRGAIRQLDWLKDEWRNPTMHARKRYSHLQAVDVFSKVKDFMQRLVEYGLTESQTKSIPWRKTKAT